jgi:phage portal protein BeeE
MAVLEGNMQFEQISLTPEDLELIEIRKLAVEEACRYFGVNPILIFSTDSSTTWGSGIEQLVDGFPSLVYVHILSELKKAHVFIYYSDMNGMNMSSNLKPKTKSFT